MVAADARLCCTGCSPSGCTMVKCRDCPVPSDTLRVKSTFRLEAMAMILCGTSREMRRGWVGGCVAVVVGALETTHTHTRLVFS